MKSLQDDHHTRARDEAHAALARAEAEQRARSAREREARLEAERVRVRLEQQAQAEEQARLASAAREQTSQAAEAEERVRLERARAALELRLAEQERKLQLGELEAQAARLRDRALFWASSALSLLLVTCALGFYYGKLRPEQALLESAQVSALSAATRRATEAEGLLDTLRKKNDELAQKNAALRDRVRELSHAPPPAAPARPTGHGGGPAAGSGAHVKPSGPCPDSWDPLLGCL